MDHSLEVVFRWVIHTHAAWAGVVIIDPKGVEYCYSFFLDYKDTTKNRADYKALIIGLEIPLELGATEINVYGDSELVINQLNREYKCKHITMAIYYMSATQLLGYWGNEVAISHIPREVNLIANKMVQMTSGAQVEKEVFEIRI